MAPLKNSAMALYFGSQLSDPFSSKINLKSTWEAKMSSATRINHLTVSPAPSNFHGGVSSSNRSAIKDKNVGGPSFLRPGALDSKVSHFMKNTRGGSTIDGKLLRQPSQWSQNGQEIRAKLDNNPTAQAKLSQIQQEKGNIKLFYEPGETPTLSPQLRASLTNTFGQTLSDIAAGIFDEGIAFISEKSFFGSRLAGSLSKVMPVNDHSTYHLARASTSLSPLAIPLGLGVAAGFASVGAGTVLYTAAGLVSSGTIFSSPTLVYGLVPK